MVLCTGKATKRIEELQYGVKEYIATLQLGATTPSFDLEHPIDQTYPTEHITRELVEETIKRFVGEIWQVPPVYSAVKIDGKRAFDYARKGQEVEIKPKLLVIDEIEVLKFEDMQLTIRVVCSKGTYIRALARDIGEALNSGAHLTALQRTQVGDIRLNDCMEVEDFIKCIESGIIKHEPQEEKRNIFLNH
jgi:tRNA pseudouridine55 synthase